MPRNGTTTQEDAAALTQEGADPQFGPIDEAVIRAVLGDKELALARASSLIAAQRQTIAALRERLAVLENRE